ncbi:TerB family tellurite resistance protein [Marinobacter sp. X15-166B]|uniref:tellurite resistance TerB family protein n=1 Tax=Marinobacter sp. X15-166B TaxID=1897620 RepID=UPI00085C74F8|nr:TerB family tellurite resistance protein [Marinobacter sp. X15-166B]OEY67127.1 hypothetical protein BG841_12125 [Marinobacter sp. X15-166B]
MLKQLKALFDQRAGANAPAAAPDKHQIAVAATALMVQLAYIDQQADPRELATIVECATKIHQVTAAEAKAILDDAMAGARDATSLYQFTGLINEHFDQAAKLTLLTHIWQVAFADGRIDKYEEHLIRRIAELLHLNHREYILARHNAGQAGTV